MSLVNNSDDNKKAELFSTSEPLEMLSASSAEGYRGNGVTTDSEERKDSYFSIRQMSKQVAMYVKAVTKQRNVHWFNTQGRHMSETF